jgi:hypothetical protein
MPQFVEPDDAHQTLIIRDPASTQASYAKRHGVQAINRTVGAPDGAARASLADEPLRRANSSRARRSTPPWKNASRVNYRRQGYVGHRQGSRCRHEHCAARERALLHPLNLAHNTIKASITSQLRRLMPVTPSDNLPSRQWFTCSRAGNRLPIADGTPHRPGWMARTLK